MNNSLKVISYAVLSSLCLTLSVPATSASNDERGYVYDSQGEVVKDSQGDCVRSSYLDKDVPISCGGTKKAEPPKKEKPVERVTPTPTPHIEKTTLEGKALFDTNKYVLKPAGKASLDKLAREIKSTPGVHEIHVIGHTDNKGSANYNQRLSERRAMTVKNYLQSKDLENITSEGRGLREPVASNATESGRSQNRRVEVEVVIQ